LKAASWTVKSWPVSARLRCGDNRAGQPPEKKIPAVV
jgi:hypothetical protein